MADAHEVPRQGGGAVDELGAGGNLNDPELISNPEASKASETITDFYFDSCG